MGSLYRWQTHGSPLIWHDNEALLLYACKGSADVWLLASDLECYIVKMGRIDIVVQDASGLAVNLWTWCIYATT